MFNTPQLDIITAQYWWATRVDPCRLAKIMLPKICHVLSVRLAHWACVSDERASTTHIATEAELLCDRQFPIGLAECYQALLNRIRADGALHRLPVVFDARALGNESGSARLAPRVQHALLNYLVAMVRPPGGGPTFALTLVRDRADVFTQYEMDLAAELGTLLADACSLSFFHRLDEHALVDRNRHAAVVRENGQIIDAQRQFIEVVKSERPEWDGWRLPFELRMQPADRIKLHADLFICVERFGQDYLVRIWKPSELDVLSGRELQCVLGICRGMSMKEIGREIGVSPSTVSTFIGRAMRKLHVNGRAQLRQKIRAASPLSTRQEDAAAP